MATGYVSASVWGTVADFPMPYSKAASEYPDQLYAQLKAVNFPPARRCKSPTTCLIHLAADPESHLLVQHYLMSLSEKMIYMWSDLSDNGKLREQEFRTTLAGLAVQLGRQSDAWSTLCFLFSFAKVVPLVCDLLLAGCCRRDDITFLAVFRMFFFHVIVNYKLRSTSVHTALHVRRTMMSDIVRIYETDAATTATTFPGPLCIAFILTAGSVVEIDVHKPPFPATEKHIIPPTKMEMSTLSQREQEAAAPPYTSEHSIRRAAVVTST
jgi:hypothetical protein